MMTMQRKPLAAIALATMLALGGCWDDDDTGTVDTPASTEVPDSAAASSAAFVSYIQTLDAADEASEPLTLKATFAVPADESAEPILLP